MIMYAGEDRLPLNEHSKERAYKVSWPKGAKVRVDSFIEGYGFISDVRKHAEQWWNYEFKVTSTTTCGLTEHIWVLEHDLHYADPWQEFERLLKRHDWTYEYSDDHRVWQAGTAERDELKRMYKTLIAFDEPRAIALWKKYEERLP
jgi:hypothetical protein